MKRGFITGTGSVLGRLGLVVLLGVCALFYLPGQAHAQAGVPPQVTVFLKNYQAEYDLSTAQFLERQFEFASSPAFGLVRYKVVTELTTDALAGSVALVIDESADMSLTDAEAAVIRQFTRTGGRVGMFVFPRYYWEKEQANPAAYQVIGDLWGVTAVGEPAAAEVTSGDSSASVLEPEDNTAHISGPYTLTGQTAATYDQIPFSPVISAFAKPVLASPALAQAPVAVANQRGIFVTAPIGDALQGSDANATYEKFVTNAIVWLASVNAPIFTDWLYLPMTSQR